jgi:hypothetical protein
MFWGILPGARDLLHPPTEMTGELKEMFLHPALNLMFKYAFAGSKQTVKNKIQTFLTETGVDELITVSTMYKIEDRIKSTRLFAEIMKEINTESRQ